MSDNFVETMQKLDLIYGDEPVEEALHIGNDSLAWRAVRDGIIDGADQCDVKLNKKQWEMIADAVIDSLHAKMDADPKNKWNKFNGR